MEKTASTEKFKKIEGMLPFAKDLDEEEKELLLSNCNFRNFKKDGIVHDGEMECTGVVGVLKGRVKTYMISPKGKEIALFRLLPDDACILSASCMMSNIVFDIHVSAEEDSQLIVINADYFEGLTKRNYHAEKFKNDIIAMRFSEVMWLVEQIMFKRMDQRIAGFLLEMNNITGSLEIQLSHQEIADNIGTAREVVSRILKYFEGERLVKISRKTVAILDMERMYEIAQE